MFGLWVHKIHNRVAHEKRIDCWRTYMEVEARLQVQVAEVVKKLLPGFVIKDS